MHLICSVEIFFWPDVIFFWSAMIFFRLFVHFGWSVVLLGWSAMILGWSVVLFGWSVVHFWRLLAHFWQLFRRFGCLFNKNFSLQYLSFRLANPSYCFAIVCILFNANNLQLNHNAGRLAAKILFPVVNFFCSATDESRKFTGFQSPAEDGGCFA